MAIASIQPVSDFTGLAALFGFSAGSGAPAADQAALVAAPGVVVTLGQNSAITPLYNSAGLLLALNQLDPSVFPSGSAAGTAEARLQEELAVAVRLNTDTLSAGILGATGTLPDLPGGAAQALENVLSNDAGVAAGTIDPNRTLAGLLSRTLNFSSSGVDGATSTAAVIDATGVLRGSSGDATIRALDSLLASDLRLAATALNTSLSSAAALARDDLLAGDGNDIGIFNDVLSASVEIPTVALEALPAIQGGSDAGTSAEVLSSAINLNSAVAGLGVVGAATGTVTAGAANLPLAGPATNGVGTGATSANSSTNVPLAGFADVARVLAEDARRVPGSLTSAPSPAAVTAIGAPSNAAAFRLPNVAADPNAIAFNSVARDPAYAAAAVAFYLSAAGFGPRTTADNPLAAVAEPPDAALVGIRAIRAVKPP